MTRVAAFVASMCAGALGQPGTSGSGGSPPPVPGLEGADFRIKEASLRYEGTFISRKTGSIVTLRTGDRAVVFQPERAASATTGVGGRAERPMILIPGTHLERLEDLAATRDSATLYALTGQVFVYRGMNYLLLSVPPMLASVSNTQGVDEPAAPQEARPEDAGSAAQSEAAPNEPIEHPIPDEPSESASGATGIGLEGKRESLDSIISQLEQVRHGQRTLGKTNEPASEAESSGKESESSNSLRASSAGLSSVPAPIAEGKLISRRIGRFVREAGGQGEDGAGRNTGSGGRWALALEGDADSPAPEPMTLVPCATLERLEAIAGVLGPGMQVQISGRVLAYRGQNYLLATMVRLTTQTELKPRQ